MWIAAAFVRGMSVDEALKQLASAKRKGATIVTTAIEEAIEMAIREHNVEFRSNLWVGTYNLMLVSPKYLLWDRKSNFLLTTRS